MAFIGFKEVVIFCCISLENCNDFIFIIQMNNNIFCTPTLDTE